MGHVTWWGRNRERALGDKPYKVIGVTRDRAKGTEKQIGADERDRRETQMTPRCRIKRNACGVWRAQVFACVS